MNTFLKICCIAAVTGTLTIGSTLAQENVPTPLASVEIFGCNFLDGKSSRDLDAVNRRYNTWADSHGINDYFAANLYPMYYSEDMTYDVLWLGATPNGVAWGKSTALWLKEGQDIQDAYNKVVECGVVMQIASNNIRQPAGEPAAGNLVTFSDCKVHEDRNVQEAVASLREWFQVLADNGVEVGAWINWIVAGNSNDADYNFKLVTGMSPEVRGKMIDYYTTGGVQTANQHFGSLLDCNSPRVYVMNPVRIPAGE